MNGEIDHYLEIDEGWKQLVYDTHYKLLNIDSEYKIFQIKEKFGSLRYYFDTKYYSSDVKKYKKMIKITNEAEELSKTICQICSKPAMIRLKNYWYATLCDTCYKEWMDK